MEHCDEKRWAVRIPAKTHRDGAGGDLGKPGGEDNGGGGVGAREAGGEGEWYREAVGDPDDDIPNDIACREVLLLVLKQRLLHHRLRCHRRRGLRPCDGQPVLNHHSDVS